MRHRYRVRVEDRTHEVEVEGEAGGGSVRVWVAGASEAIVVETAGARLLRWQDGLRVVRARVEPRGADRGLRIFLDGLECDASIEEARFSGVGRDERRAPSAGGAAISVTAPMAGKIVKVCVRAGETVALGQALFVAEAMKMENEIVAPRAGTIDRIDVRDGQAVECGAILAVIG